MRTGKSRLGVIGVAVAGGLLIAAGSGGTAAADASDDFLRLQQAVKAQELCRNGGRKYSRDTQHKLAKKIDEAIGHDIGTGERLSLVVKAQTEVRNLYNARTCADSRMRDLLSLFESELGSAL